MWQWQVHDGMLICILVEDARSCTCFPDDWPPYLPCQQKFALKDCMKSAIDNNIATIK